MFHLSMLAIFGWASITEYFKQKKESRPIMKLLVPAVIAVIDYLVGGSIEKYHENKRKSIFAIETNTIETNMGNRQVDINVKVCTGRMSSFTINYPVQGMITRIEPHNPLTEVQKTHFQVRGSTDGISLNNAEIISEGVKANVNLQYTIYYKPMSVPIHIVIPERDTYTITYTWKYKGKEDSNTEWYFIKNDQKTGKPWVELTDFTHVTTQEGK